MKEELSDFLKIAYKYNRVKDLKEAFEEYPVEEEWHKGKIEEYKKSFYESLQDVKEQWKNTKNEISKKYRQIKVVRI